MSIKPATARSRLTTALIWVAAAVPALPLGIILHELAHHFTALAFGFAGATLHYASATYALESTIRQHLFRGDLTGAAAIYPLWQIAVNAGIGPLASYLVMLACCLIAWRRPCPLLIATALTVNLRILPITLFMLRQPKAGGNDENVVAQILGFSPLALALPGLALTIVGVVWAIWCIPQGQRVMAGVSMLVGIVIGGILFFAIGPVLLP